MFTDGREGSFGEAGMGWDGVEWFSEALRCVVWCGVVWCVVVCSGVVWCGVA